MRLIALLVVLALPLPLGAQPVAAPEGQAYYEFLLARRLEAQDDAEGALAALQRARTLDPKSAEIPAEMAGFYARQNQGPEAVAAAEEALKLDPDNAEAHRILGLIYSAWADSNVPPPSGRTTASLRTEAIDHLTKILDTPTVATDLNLQVTLARLQLRAGRPADAIPVLEGIVSQAPFAAEPYALLAEARVSTGQLDEAAEALGQAAEINPRYYLSLGELNERRRNWAGAAAAYEQAVAGMRTPSRDLRMRWIGALLNVPGGTGATKARDLLQEWLKTNAKDARAWYLLSVAQRSVGDMAGADEAARQLLAIDPTSLTALYALTQTRFEQHDYRGVLDVTAPFSKDVAARAKGREAEAALLLTQIGLAHQQLAEHDAAVAAFTRARELDPENPAYDAYLVQGQIAAKRFDRAIAASAEALARHPDDDRITRLRAEALVGAGRPAEGLKVLETAVAGAPDNRDLVVALSAMYADQKQFDAAVRVLESASGRLGDDEALTLQLGAVFEEAGRLADAERQFRRLLERDPLHATALNYLGYMLAENGQRLPEAVELIQRALKIDPENPAYLDSLGWAFFKQGKVKEAEEPLRKAADALRDNSVIQAHYGDVLAALGRHDEAAAAWQRALAGDGEAIDRADVEKKIKDARGRRR